MDCMIVVHAMKNISKYKSILERCGGDSRAHNSTQYNMVSFRMVLHMKNIPLNRTDILYYNYLVQNEELYFIADISRKYNIFPSYLESDKRGNKKR